MAKKEKTATPTVDAAPAPEANGQPAAAPKPSANKTVCPLTRKQFGKGARPLMVVINGEKLAANPREFGTGSLGWYVNGKIVMDGEQFDPTLKGVPVAVQIGVNLTVVGSKELPKPE